MGTHGPDKLSVVASATVHAAVLAGIWWSQSQTADPVEFETYQIELVSLADIEEPATEPPAPEVEVEAPEPPQPEPVQEELPPPPEPEPEPEPEPPPPEPEPEPEPPPPTPEPQPETPSPPEQREETEEVSADQIRVRMDGLRRDFPAYYENIILQIHRCFRWRSSGNWTAIVQFEIQSDGMVPSGSIQLVQRSGNVGFDIEAQGAVECAGSGRFGPLPPELPWDALPIRFSFSPEGESES